MTSTTGPEVPRRDRRLALPVAVGLGLFLGGGRLVTVLATAAALASGDSRAALVVVGAVLTYGGAVVAAVGALALARRLLMHQVTGDGATAHPPRPGRHRPALLAVVVGLLLMAASQLAAELSLALGDGYHPGPGLGGVGLALALVGTYLGPLVTAVGTYLALRRLEGVTTRRRPEVLPDVTDLDA